MHKNYTGDFNGSFAQRPNQQYLDQSLKSTAVHNNINLSDTQSGFSKKTNNLKRMKTVDSSDDEERAGKKEKNAAAQDDYYNFDR